MKFFLLLLTNAVLFAQTADWENPAVFAVNQQETHVPFVLPDYNPVGSYRKNVRLPPELWQLKKNDSR